MNDDKVMVTSMVNGQVGLHLPQLRYNRVWPTKGTRIPVSKDLLREAIYEPGVEYIFKNGILYIDDMDFKIELGLESEETKVPTQIIPMDDKYLNRVLKLMPISDMKEAISKMNSNQKEELILYATKQNDISLDRIGVIDKLCNTNILKTMQLIKSKEE